MTIKNAYPNLDQIESLIKHIRERNLREREPEDSEECEHRVCAELFEDSETGEVCETHYCNLDGNCPYPSLMEDCELVRTKEE